DINALSISELFDKHLLVAISSLLMGSKRGHVTRVVSLNYDSMLEWFLSLFGFVVKTIFELPTVEGDEDVRIYHIHGFLPHDALNAKSSKEDELILGMEAIDRRLGNQGDLWFELTRHILYTGNCLFIGMSTRTLSDRALSPLLVSASDKLKDIRPTGFWLVMDDLDETKENEYRRKNLIPLKINDLNELVEFIFQISQSAIINT
ncbi:MAG: SIR2 family protein, partial [Bacteroidetes bacterium]|nr:SIR2 family protein [Bacteroidota bacterium]